MMLKLKVAAVALAMLGLGRFTHAQDVPSDDHYISITDGWWTSGTSFTVEGFYDRVTDGSSIVERHVECRVVGETNWRNMSNYMGVAYWDLERDRWQIPYNIPGADRATDQIEFRAWVRWYRNSVWYISDVDTGLLFADP